MQLYVPAAKIGDLIFRYMFADHLHQLMPYASITGAPIPEWGIVPPVSTPPAKPLVLPSKHRIDVDAITMATLDDPSIDGIELQCFAQRLEYFEGKRDRFNAAFRSAARGQRIYSHEIVVAVGLGLKAGHPDYWPVPISYMRRVIAETGLRPVFSGQIASMRYARALRTAFPKSRFLVGNHWLDDFETLRNAENIVLSVSTFAWTAAWLSTTAKRIYMPLLGFLNPAQRPDIDLLPRSDGRYIAEEFPVEKFKATPDQLSRIFA